MKKYILCNFAQTADYATEYLYVREVYQQSNNKEIKR